MQKLSIWGNPLKPEGYGKRAKNKAKKKRQDKKSKNKDHKQSQRKPKTKLNFYFYSRGSACNQLGFKNYDAYMRSALWKSIRQKVLEESGHQCCLCERRATLVHHLKYDYDTLAGNKLGYLYPLCESCHGKVHYKDGRMRTPQGAIDAFNTFLRARFNGEKV